MPWLVGALLVFGCSDGTLTGGNPDDPTRPPVDPVDPFDPTQPRQNTLSIVGAAEVFVPVGDRVDLSVRYQNADGQPIAQQTVRFDVAVASTQAVIGSLGLQTDSAGIATLPFEVTSVPDIFIVLASAPDAEPVGWTVVVEGQLPITGVFDVDTELDLLTSANGVIGRVLRTLDDLTDDPGDPALYVLNLIADETSFPSFLAASLAPNVNNYLLTQAPWLLDELSRMANETASIMSRFGVTSTLQISQPPGALEATHTLNGFFFTIYGRQRLLPFSGMGIDAIRSDPFALEFDKEGRMLLGKHTVQVPYGAVIRTLIDEVIVADIDAGADGLGDLFNDFIDCAYVGSQVASYLGVVNSFTYKRICETGLEAAASYVYSQIAGIRCSDCGMSVEGTATMILDPETKLIKDFIGGVWVGDLELKASSYSLTPETAQFTATRRF